MLESYLNNVVIRKYFIERSELTPQFYRINNVIFGARRYLDE